MGKWTRYSVLKPPLQRPNPAQKGWLTQHLIYSIKSTYQCLLSFHFSFNPMEPLLILGIGTNYKMLCNVKKWANTGLFFFIFVFSTVNSKYNQCKILPMTGFEPRISGFGSDRSANWATTTAQSDTSLPRTFNTILYDWCYMTLIDKDLFRCAE